MAAKKTKLECASCRRLARRVAKLEGELAKVMDELAKAKKNSSNSSKPPSGEIVNPVPKQETGKSKGELTDAAGTNRKRGGQPGHKRHQRTPFQPDEIDATWLHYDVGCPCCGGKLVDTELPDKVLQQVEIKEVLIRIEEHRRPTQECLECHQRHGVAWPEDLKKAGLVGPRLTALIGYLRVPAICRSRRFVRISETS